MWWYEVSLNGMASQNLVEEQIMSGSFRGYLPSSVMFNELI
jgi:hypothetical protein